MKLSRISRLLVSLMSFGLARHAPACDLCAIYNVMDAQALGGIGWNVGVGQQFTHFGTLQRNGSEVSNDARQRFDSSITQVVFGHNFTERFGIQLNVPFIYREFRRPEEERGIRNDETAGVGDLSLLGNVVALRHESDKTTFTWMLTAGVKFPTGSTRRLAEETREDHQHGGEATAPEIVETEGPHGTHVDDHDRHAAHAGHHHDDPVTSSGESETSLPESGIHGHDLTLGSGAWDGIVGTSVFLRHQRFFFTGAMQYAIRSRGDFGYRFANDLVWNGGPGVYLALDERYTAAIQLNCSGEHKGKDRFRGANAEDTGITALYLGPEVRLTWRDRVSAEFGADFPVNIDNTALQIVPDYRLRASISVRF